MSMEKFYLITGVKMLTILIIGIIINQPISKLLNKKKLSFITSILNICVVLALLFTFQESVHTISSQPNIRLLFGEDMLYKYSTILASVVILVFVIQFIKGFVVALKYRTIPKEEREAELPILKPSIGIKLRSEKEYPLPNKKICPKCGIENDKDAENCFVCTTKL